MVEIEEQLFEYTKKPLFAKMKNTLYKYNLKILLILKFQLL